MLSTGSLYLVSWSHDSFACRRYQAAHAVNVFGSLLDIFQPEASGISTPLILSIQRTRPYSIRAGSLTDLPGTGHGIVYKNVKRSDLKRSAEYG